MRGEPLGGLVDVGARERSRRVVRRLAGHAGVAVAEELDPVDAEDLGRPRAARRRGGRRAVSPGASASGAYSPSSPRVADDEHDAVTLALGARHRAAGRDRLVVGMGVEENECVRHRFSSSLRSWTPGCSLPRGVCAVAIVRSRNLTLASGFVAAAASSTHGGHHALTNCRRHVQCWHSSRWPAATPARRKAASRPRRTTPGATSDHRGIGRRPEEERPDQRRPGRHRHGDQRRGHHREDEPASAASYGPYADGIKAYFNYMNSDRRDLRPQARRSPPTATTSSSTTSRR